MTDQIEEQTPPPFVPREAAFNSNFCFSIREALSAGWKLLLTDFWPFVGLFAIATVITSIAWNLIIPLLFISYMAMGGYFYYSLLKLRGQPADIDVIFEGFKRNRGDLAMLSFLVSIPFILLFGAYGGFIGYASLHPEFVELNPALALGIIFGGALICSIILPIFVTVTWLATLLTLDCGTPWKKAYGLANRAFLKRPIRMTVFSFLAMLLLNAGSLLLFVGVFVSGAWIANAYSHLYTKAFEEPSNR